MPVSVIDPWALVQSAQAMTTTLELGANWQPGDVRVYFLSVSTSRSFSGASAGWSFLSASSSAAAVSRTTAILARVLQDGDTAPQLTVAGASGPNAGHLGVTLRGVDTAALMGTTPTIGGSNTASTSVTAPSINVGPGFLITAHWITRTASANSGNFAAPSGMTREAWAVNDGGTTGYNVLLGSLPTTSGTSGARSATAATSGTWSAASLFVPESAVVAPELGRGLLAA